MNCNARSSNKRQETWHIYNHCDHVYFSLSRLPVTSCNWAGHDRFYCRYYSTGMWSSSKCYSNINQTRYKISHKYLVSEKNNKLIKDHWKISNMAFMERHVNCKAKKRPFNRMCQQRFVTAVTSPTFYLTIFSMHFFFPIFKACMI